MDAKKELVLRLYDNMYGEIDRHQGKVWESVSVVATVIAAAYFAEYEGGGPPVWFLVAVALCSLTWFMGNIVNAAYINRRCTEVIRRIQMAGESGDGVSQFDLVKFREAMDKVSEMDKDGRIHSPSSSEVLLTAHYQIQMNFAAALALLVVAYFIWSVVCAIREGVDWHQVCQVIVVGGLCVVFMECCSGVS